MNSGVGRKIDDQLSMWRENGHEVTFFSHLTKLKNSEQLIAGENFYYSELPGFFGRVKTEFNRSRAILSLVHAVEEYQPDLIYLRWGMYVFPSHLLFNIAPVVIEINTNDVLQHHILGPVLSFYNKITRWVYLSRASGLVYVSHELSKNIHFTKFRKPGIVIANGIDLRSNLPVPAPNNARPRLGFIGSPDMVWHGVDKLIKLATLCPDLDVDIIGLDFPNTGEEIPGNLVFHGYLDKARSSEILSKVDVGLSTLALHRINLNEASVLKSREYLAYGIPTIISYQDTDLAGLDLHTILKLPNTEDNISSNWETIREFSYRMRGQRVLRDEISNRIGLEEKEISRIEFFSERISV
jgi:hypothetical protein